MPSGIATGPHTRAESIRAWIRRESSVLEPGLRLIDFDFRLGAQEPLDAIGLDNSGALALVVVATADQQMSALDRLLDAHLWAADQRHLLGRLYADRGLIAERAARGFLLAPSFTHAFLRRLSLLSVDVVPFLARDVDCGGTLRTIVEPAATLFGMVPTPARVSVAAPEPTEGRTAEDRRPFWPDGVLPPEEDTLPRRAAPDLPAPGPAGDPNADMPWPEGDDESFPWELDIGRSGSARPANRDGDVLNTEAHPPPEGDTALPRDAIPAAPFENLTSDEMEEFERFERQRRERGRRSS